MGKQRVVIAVLFAMREDRHASGIGGTGSTAPKHARLCLNDLILYVCEAFPESNCAALIGEWAINYAGDRISIRISARYVGLVFQDCIAGDRMQENVMGFVSCNYLVNSVSMSRS